MSDQTYEVKSPLMGTFYRSSASEELSPPHNSHLDDVPPGYHHGTNPTFDSLVKTVVDKREAKRVSNSNHQT